MPNPMRYGGSLLYTLHDDIRRSKIHIGHAD